MQGQPAGSGQVRSAGLGEVARALVRDECCRHGGLVLTLGARTIGEQRPGAGPNWADLGLGAPEI